MKNRFVKILPFIIVEVVAFTGCDSHTAKESTLPIAESVDMENTLDELSKSLTKENDLIEENSENDEQFSKKDISNETNIQNAVEVTLNDQDILANSDGVTISGTTITIGKEGTYIFSGTLNDGNIIVNTNKDEKVQIILNGVSINSKTFAPIYVVHADEVIVTMEEGTTNTLTNGGSFTLIDKNNVDAVIYSKDDITLNGAGTLKIVSPAGEGITGKDELTITSGTYEITSSGTAIRANDRVAIADGSFTIMSDTDGIHAENNDDDSLGDIYIEGGYFDINAKDDGIHATTNLVVDGGIYDITAAEGIEATVVMINDGNISIAASDDGINAAQKTSLYNPKVEINGGDISIVMGNGDTDGVDSNGDIIINGGTINVTGNSTFDYDGEGTINGGTVIANGEEITTLPNQMMGGRGGMRGQKGDNKWQNSEMMEPRGDMNNPNGEMMEPRGDMNNPNGETMEPRGDMNEQNNNLKKRKGKMNEQNDSTSGR